ncbi:MAG: hypothetical protein ACQESB_03865 [Elusimicrobiota bacterium]
MDSAPFNYDAPFIIKDTDIFRDGGTTFAVLEDKNKKELVVCFDHQIGSKTKNRIYFGDVHPTKENAELVAINSSLEKNILDALQDAIDKIISEQEQKELLQKKRSGLSEENYRMRHLLRALSYYKQTWR